jgi:cytoskeletal protein CcmA (bactofilin family)
LSARIVNILSTGDLNGRLSYGKLEIESGANIALKLRKTKQLSDTPVENLDINEEM